MALLVRPIWPLSLSMAVTINDDLDSRAPVLIHNCNSEILNGALSLGTGRNEKGTFRRQTWLSEARGRFHNSEKHNHSFPFDKDLLVAQKNDAIVDARHGFLPLPLLTARR